ncbi:hypothetical protein [Shewanella sp. ENK2]|uniref:hypothetical protein n=1 Tax=Shewanella sp. ENK2 TaxID=2775245 RepID=UPI00374A1B21
MLKQAFVGLLAAASFSGHVNADEYKFTIGAFYASSDSTMLVKSAKDTNSYYLLDFEDDLLLTEDQFLPFLNSHIVLTTATISILTGSHCTVTLIHLN